MEEESKHVRWADLRAALLETKTAGNLLYHLKEKRALVPDEILLLSLFMQEEAHARASNISALMTDYQAQFAAEKVQLEKASLAFSEATSKSTDALKNATCWLAVATVVLALSAVVDIALRVFCGI